jgi:hypothetical protein
VVADGADRGLLGGNGGPVADPVSDQEERRLGVPTTKGREQPGRVRSGPVVEGESDIVPGRTAAEDRHAEAGKARDGALPLPGQQLSS